MTDRGARAAVFGGTLTALVVGLAGCGESEPSVAATATSLAPYTPGSVVQQGLDAAEQSSSAASAASASQSAVAAREAMAKMSDAIAQARLTYTVEAGQQVCSALRSGQAAGVAYSYTPSRFLAEHEHVGLGDAQGQGAALAVQNLCPEFRDDLSRAESGQWFFAPFTIPGDGSYVVGSDIPPGRYQAASSGDLITDCYWERSKPSGETLDNDYVTAAQQITAGAGALGSIFTTRGCGSWDRVG
jgi:hypothetical protein